MAEWRIGGILWFFLERVCLRCLLYLLCLFLRRMCVFGESVFLTLIVSLMNRRPCLSPKEVTRLLLNVKKR